MGGLREPRHDVNCNSTKFIITQPLSPPDWVVPWGLSTYCMVGVQRTAKTIYYKTGLLGMNGLAWDVRHIWKRVLTASYCATTASRKGSWMGFEAKRPNTKKKEGRIV